MRHTLFVVLFAALISTGTAAKENASAGRSRTEASGSELIGADLYHKCLKGDQAANELECRGFVEGFLAGLQIGGVINQTRWTYCRPASGVSVDQGRDIIEDYLHDHPEVQNEEAGISAAAALSRAFPCP
jgi:hypothetical protein